MFFQLLHSRNFFYDLFDVEPLFWNRHIGYTWIINVKAFFIEDYHLQFLREEERDACMAFVVGGWTDSKVSVGDKETGISPSYADIFPANLYT